MRGGLGLFAVLAVLGHLLLIGGLVAYPRALSIFGRTVKPPPGQATIELVMQDTPTVGGSKPSAPSSSRRAADGTRTAQVRPQPAPLSSPNATDRVAVAPEAAAAKPSPSTSTVQAQSASALASAEVNLDGDDPPGTGLVSGDNVVPASPESRYKNAPPIYPIIAQERGEEGAVLLVVTVAADGHAANVEIASSSGHKLLDDEARRAVSRWRFRPAIRGGQPVQSFFNEEIDFDGRARP